MVTPRQLRAVKAVLDNARDVCTEQEIVAALTEASDELAVAILDLEGVAETLQGDQDRLTQHMAQQMFSAGTQTMTVIS